MTDQTAIRALGSRRSRRGRPTLRAAAVLGLLLLTLPTQEFVAQAVDSDSVIAGIRILPLGRRASVVVELENDIDQLAIADSTEQGVFAVTFGPIEERLTPMTLEATHPSRLVREVKIRERVRPDGARMVRVEVVAREPLRGSVRTSLRHLYLDVAAVSR